MSPEKNSLAEHTMEFGRFHFVYQGDCCSVGGGKRLRVVSTTANVSACEEHCLSEPGCSHISRRSTGMCALCGSCTLRQHSGHFYSYSREPMPSPVDRIVPLLQGNYSTELYGAPDRVDASTIRLIWLQLLPDAVLRMIARLGGVCKYESGYPWRPFLASLDLSANPLDAAWVSWERAQTGGSPVGNSSWIEVTHCSQGQGRVGARGFGWQFGPMWLYAAPGSGVSINVGRTVIMSYTDAARLLRRVYPSALECACEPGCEFGLRATSVGSNNATQRNGSSCISSAYWQTPVGSIENDGPPAPSKLRWYTRCWTRDDVLAELDTIQIYSHLEYYGREKRHEIVRLRHDGECAKLTPSTPSLMCGRTPYLHRCAEESAALRRVNKCVSGKAPISAHLPAAVNFTRGRCAMTSNF